MKKSLSEKYTQREVILAMIESYFGKFSSKSDSFEGKSTLRNKRRKRIHLLTKI